jgi:membrane protein
MAAGVTFFVIFSIFPLMLGLIAIFGVFADSAEVKGELLDWIATSMPAAEDVMRTNIESITASRGTIGVIGIIGLFWSASAVFGALARAINIAWGTKEQRSFVRSKLLAIGMALSVGLLFALSAVTTAALQVLASLPGALTGNLFGDASVLVGLASLLAGLAINTLSITLLYTVVPVAATDWRKIWRSALFVSIVLEALKFAFVSYLGTFANYEAVYGPLGSVIALLFWILLSVQVVLLGAELAALRAAPAKS